MKILLVIAGLLLLAGCDGNGLTDRMDNYFDPGSAPSRSHGSSYPERGYRSGPDYPSSPYREQAPRPYRSSPY